MINIPSDVIGSQLCPKDLRITPSNLTWVWSPSYWSNFAKGFFTSKVVNWLQICYYLFISYLPAIDISNQISCMYSLLKTTKWVRDFYMDLIFEMYNSTIFLGGYTGYPFIFGHFYGASHNNHPIYKLWGWKALHTPARRHCWVWLGLVW